MKKWNEIRQKGRKPYIWKTWVIYWGLSTAILWSLAMSFAQPADANRLLPLIGFITFPLAGFVAGRIMWAINEKKYAGELHSENS